MPLLAEILKDPKTIDMTFHNVLRDLADSRNSGALELWIDMLLNNSDNQRRTQAARALGQLGDRKAIEPLERALVADAYIDVLREAAYALVRIDETVGYQPMMNRLATSQDGRALAAAIKATGEKGFLTALRMVVDQKDQNGAVLRLGMNYLRIFQDRQSIEIIAKHLNNSDPEVARAAFQELRWLRVPEEEIQKMSKEQAIDR